MGALLIPGQSEAVIEADCTLRHFCSYDLNYSTPPPPAQLMVLPTQWPARTRKSHPFVDQVKHILIKTAVWKHPLAVTIIS